MLTFLDFLGTLCGLLYLYFEYKANIRLWIVSMVMPAIDLFVYYQAGLYADFGMAVYYLLASVYGWAIWTRKRNVGTHDETVKNSVSLPITHTPRHTVAVLCAVFFILWGAMFFVLDRFTNSTVPVTDSFGNALSIVALWMLAHKYLEQWLLWFVVDALFFVLYIYKGIPFHGCLYGFYTVMAIAGYRNWLHLMRQQRVP